VDGGFRLKDKKMNDMVSDRVDRAMAAFDRRPDKESHRAGTKKEFCDELKKITCRSDDTLTIFFMGHGTRGKLHFTLPANLDKEKRTLSQKDLQTKIQAQIPNCGCKVRLVIFACHSGSLLTELFGDKQNKHTQAVYTSCRSNQVSHADAYRTHGDVFVNNGNEWADAFIRKWEAADRNEDIGVTLAEANKCANKNTTSRFAQVQEPTGWQKGTVELKAHVVTAISRNSSRACLRIYEPSHLRGKKINFAIDPTNVTLAARIPACTWITFNAEFGLPTLGVRKEVCPKKAPVMVTASVASGAPTECYLGHVERGLGNGRVRLRVVEPNWLSGEARTLKANFARGVQVCSFVQGKANLTNGTGYLDGSNQAPVAAFDYCPEISGKVCRISRAAGRVYFKIHFPAVMANIYKGTICVTLPPGERGVLRTLKKYGFIRCKIKAIPFRKGTFRVSNVRHVSVAAETFSGVELGIGEVVKGTGEISDGEPFVPVLEVGNQGEQDYVAGANLEVELCDSLMNVVYNESLPVPPLASGEALHLTFPEWLPQPGDFKLSATLDVSGVPDDGFALNNQLESPFTVVPEDSEEPWAAQFLHLPLPMDFQSSELVVLAPGVGNGPGGNNDEAGFVYQPVSGDFMVGGFVDSQFLNPGASVGFMARTELAPDEPMVAWMFGGNGNLDLLIREVPGGNANVQGQVPQPGPVWMGLERSGDTFNALTSPDGNEWDVVASGTLSGFPPDLLLGIAAASGQDENQPPSLIPILELRGLGDC